MDDHLTKRRVRTLLSPEATDADVARFFGISNSAVSQWPEDQAIPELRQFQAALKRPDLFGATALGAAANDGADDEQDGRRAATGSDVEVPHGVEAQAAGQGGDVVHAGHRGSRAGRDA